MKIIAVANQKGGCGKTITAVNLAAALSKRNHRVLLIDLDPQGHATFSLRQNSNVSITDIFERTMDNDFTYSDALNNLSANLSFISSTLGLTALENQLSQRKDRLEILTRFLQTVEHQFDYCLIDCAPNLGLVTLNALQASQYTLLPLNLCDFSLRGIEIFKNILIMLRDYSGHSPIPFCVFSQVDRRSSFARTFIYRVKEQLGNLLLDTAIRTNSHLREAIASGKHIFDYMADSRGAQDFISLAEEVEMITNRPGWASLFLKNEQFSEVYAVGDFSNWEKREQYRLNRIGSDILGINIPLEKGTYRYKFVSGDSWFADPHNKATEQDPFGGYHSLLSVE